MALASDFGETAEEGVLVVVCEGWGVLLRRRAKVVSFDLRDGVGLGCCRRAEEEVVVVSSEMGLDVIMVDGSECSLSWEEAFILEVLVGGVIVA